MTIHDEQDLRERLRAVSAATPPAPAERADSAVRRAGSIKRRRAAVAAVAVLVPAVAVGAVVTRSAAPRSLDPASPASWPDLRDPALADLEQPALEGLPPHASPAGEERPHWLWSGRVPGTARVVMAFAVCDRDRCSRVVMQHGDEDLVRQGEDTLGWSPWDTTTWEVPRDAPARPLSEYFDTDGTFDGGPRTVLFVLPGPRAAEVGYETPARGDLGGDKGRLKALRGAFHGDVGYLVGNPTITVRNADGTALYTGQVGEGDSVGRARLIAAPDLPAGFEERMTKSRQVGLNGGDGHVAERMERERLALFVRCVAAAPMDVTYEGETETVPCDGTTHQVGTLTRPHAPFDPFDYRVQTTDPYAVYAATLAEPVT